MRERLTVGAVQVSSDGHVYWARVSTLLSIDSDVPSHAAVSTALHRYVPIPRHPGNRGEEQREEKER